MPAILNHRRSVFVSILYAPAICARVAGAWIVVCSIIVFCISKLLAKVFCFILCISFVALRCPSLVFVALRCLWLVLVGRQRRAELWVWSGLSLSQVGGVLGFELLHECAVVGKDLLSRGLMGRLRDVVK